MQQEAGTYEWFYIGHFGQLGPLSAEQMEDLIRDGVIEHDTYIWRSGMSDWIRASSSPDFGALLRRTGNTTPPPPPTPGSVRPQNPPTPPAAPTFDSPPYSPSVSSVFADTTSPYARGIAGNLTPYELMPVSDRSRVAAGILGIIIPGIGRMYLGYWVQGFLQFMTSFCFGLGYIWSIVDGVLILTGTPKLDGYGRRLRD